MSLLMGPSPSNRTSTGIPAIVRSSRPTEAKFTGTQAKAVKGFLAALDTLSFDPDEFAQMLTQMSTGIQRQFIRIVLAYFKTLSMRVDRGLCDVMNEDQYDLHINGHLIHQRLNKIFPS